MQAISCYIPSAFGEQAGLSTLVVVSMYTILLLLRTGFPLHIYLNDGL